MLRNRQVKKSEEIRPAAHRAEALAGYCSPTVNELQMAELDIFRRVQSDHFQDDLKIIRKQEVDEHQDTIKHSVRKNSPMSRLDPFVDHDGLIRVGGRMKHSQLDMEQRHPVILPRAKECHVTTLLIRHFHERTHHQGRGITTNELRANGLWILGCSAAVSGIIYHFVTCRRLRSKTQEQKMADLPIDRVDPCPPFSYCGVDYFGPFHVKEGRRELKRYGVIFTCLTCRAIHLEIANTLDTDSFINALRRFLSVRGPIRQLRSDRGTNFIGAERELREAVSELDDKRIAQFLLKEGCDFFAFKMNVPSASHMGGVWERQIRTVRSILSVLLHQFGKQLDDESLRTLICEVMAIVNSRPLSVENLNDPLSDSPLTSNHLLTMKCKVLLPPPGEFTVPYLYMRRRWRCVQYLADQFWIKWQKEYLNMLQSRSKCVSERRSIKIGDIVIVKDDNLPCNELKIAQVEKAVLDSDGLVRKVAVRIKSVTLDERGKTVVVTSFLERPIHKLVLLLESEQ